MDDDFDNGMGIPDDELGGESAGSDLGDEADWRRRRRRERGRRRGADRACLWRSPRRQILRWRAKVIRTEQGRETQRRSPQGGVQEEGRRGRQKSQKGEQAGQKKRRSRKEGWGEEGRSKGGTEEGRRQEKEQDEGRPPPISRRLEDCSGVAES